MFPPLSTVFSVTTQFIYRYRYVSDIPYRISRTCRGAVARQFQNLVLILLVTWNIDRSYLVSMSTTRPAATIEQFDKLQDSSYSSEPCCLIVSVVCYTSLCSDINSLGDGTQKSTLLRRNAHGQSFEMRPDIGDYQGE